MPDSQTKSRKVVSTPFRTGPAVTGGPTARDGTKRTPARGGHDARPESVQPPPSESADLRREELLFDKFVYRVAADYALSPDGLDEIDLSSEAIKGRLVAAISELNGPKPRVYARGKNGAADVSGWMLLFLAKEGRSLDFPVLLKLKVEMAEAGRVTVNGTATLNGMDCLATWLGIDNSTNRSIDDNTNHLGRPASQIDDGLAALQLDLLEAVLAGVLQLFPWLARAAAGGDLALLEGSFGLASAEVCADISVDDAERLMRFAASAWQHGMAGRGVRQFLGSWKGTDVPALGPPVTTFAANKSTVRCKAYAKRPDCVRLEVVAPRPGGVRAMLEGADVPTELTAASAREQLRAFADEARPLADRQFDFLERVSRSGRMSPADLAIALRPLFDLAAGERSGKNGAPPSPRTREEAKMAINGLVTGVGYKVGGDAAKSVLRKVLDGLCKGGTLQKHHRLLHYSVRADFAKACMEYAIAARPVVQCLAPESCGQECAGGTAHGLDVEETPASSMAPVVSPGKPDVPRTIDDL